MENMEISMRELDTVVSENLSVNVEVAGIMLTLAVLMIFILASLTVLSKIRANAPFNMVFMGVVFSSLGFTYLMGWTPTWVLFLVSMGLFALFINDMTGRGGDGDGI